MIRPLPTSVSAKRLPSVCFRRKTYNKRYNVTDGSVLEIAKTAASRLTLPQTVFDKGHLTMSIRLEDFESVDDEHSQMVIDLLTACDDEFVPPLSSRHSTTQRELESVIANTAGITTVIVGAVIEYFDDMRRHQIVLAVDECEDGERLVGFVSYIRDYRLDFIDEPVTYVSTICVDKRRRKQGTRLDAIRTARGHSPFQRWRRDSAAHLVDEHSALPSPRQARVRVREAHTR